MKWFLLTILVFVCSAVDVHAGSKKTASQLTDELSMVASGLFNDVCLKRYFEPLGRVSYLGGEYTQHSEESTRVLLDYLTIKKGMAWKAVFFGGVFDVVVSEANGCHILAYNTNSKILHNSLSNLQEVAFGSDAGRFGFGGFRQYKHSYFLPKESKGILKSSIVASNEDKDILQIFVKTQDREFVNRKKPDALLSLVVGRY